MAPREIWKHFIHFFGCMQRHAGGHVVRVWQEFPMTDFFRKHLWLKYSKRGHAKKIFLYLLQKKRNPSCNQICNYEFFAKYLERWNDPRFINTPFSHTHFFYNGFMSHLVLLFLLCCNLLIVSLLHMLCFSCGISVFFMLLQNYTQANSL